MKNINFRKISLIIIFILILLVLALLVGKVTYSYLAPTIDPDKTLNGEVTATGDTLLFSKGDNLSLSATTDNFKTSGSNLSDTTNPQVKLVASSKTNNASATYYVGINILSNSFIYSTTNSTPELILTIKDENGANITSVNGLTYVTQGGVSGFDVTNKTGTFDIKVNYPISTTSSTTGTTHTWTFTLTFVNLSSDQSVNENARIKINTFIQKEKTDLGLHTTCNDNSLACYIAKKYTGTQGENNIYYHNSSLENGAGDNSYRFAGASDTTNNYVCFGSDESTCPTDNLYRIIGVFGDQVKLIKYDYATSTQLGTDGAYYGTDSASNYSTYKGSLSTLYRYYWTSSSNSSNVWSGSALNIVNLNTNYITYLNNLNTKWTNMIDMTMWKVGGNTWANIGTSAMNIAYQNEIVSPSPSTIHVGKIGLMYVSDYGYAASPTYWTYKGYDTAATTDYRVAISANWMYMGYYDWTITRDSDYSDLAFDIDGAGFVGYFSVNNYPGVRPVFYLNPSVTRTSGTGTSSDPYRVA